MYRERIERKTLRKFAFGAKKIIGHPVRPSPSRSASAFIKVQIGKVL